MAFARAVGRLFTHFGVAASYQPAMGAPIACTVVFTRPDLTVGLGALGVVAPQRLADVRAVEVAAPAAGDSLVVGSETLAVMNVAIDELGLVWTLDLSK